MIAKWQYYNYFSKREMDCKQTGENNMQHEFMLILEAIRVEYGKPMKVTSGYRSPRHSIEVAKQGRAAGEHTLGRCADIYCDNGADRFRLITLALKHGITRIGVAKNFIHLGSGGNNLPQNVIWDYQ